MKRIVYGFFVPFYCLFMQLVGVASAAGNWHCQVRNGSSGPIWDGYGVLSDGACQDAAMHGRGGGACPTAVAPNSKLFACSPWPADVTPGQTLTTPGGVAGICSDGGCSQGSGVEITVIATNSPSLGGINVVANSQQTTGTNWGPQYGNERIYRSAQGSSPDVVGFTGPEDGIVAIEVQAEQGVNGTTISNVSLTDSGGTAIGTVTHITSNPDQWQVFGTANALASYSLNVTFNHTGGYGQYAVKMATTQKGSSSTTPVYVPQIGFVDGSGTVHQTGITYDSSTSGSYYCDGNFCTVTVNLKLTNAGTDNSTYSTVISLPVVSGNSLVPAQGGNGNATIFNDQLGSAENVTVNVAAGSSWAYLYIPTSGGQAVLPRSDVLNNLWLTTTFVYKQ